MKKYFYLLAIVLGSVSSAYAAAGDTTWVQANIAQLSWNGNYDTTISFPAPGTTYRRIYMIFTLGKYVCPGSPTYCGDWDYTVNNYLMTPGGDTLELGRLITPYANASAPRTPWAWTQHYVYDVTDYAMLLHNTATVRIGYSGYSGGFTGNIRFAFIEGTPDRDVIAVKRLWHGYFGYGDTTHHDSNNINVHFPYINNIAPPLTQAAELKFTVTGHGSDPNYCCEFMSHNYGVFLNSTKVDSYTIWRADCGYNDLYPQSGTWIYDRANWCPGAMVYSEHHKLPGVTPASPVNVAIQFDPYISNGAGGYGVDGALFFYKGMNKTLDASLDQIITPSNDENHYRTNPFLGGPVVHVKNTGATAIDSITFEYGVTGYATHSYTWAGTLQSLQESDITLAILPELGVISGSSGLHDFTCRITAVNGVADEDSTNDKAATQFVAAPLWPSSIKMVFKANSERVSPSSGICETNWVIYDVNNNVYAQRTDANINTTYTDTVNFTSGLYKLVITDGSCDGLQWWAMSGQPGYTTGYINVKQLSNVLIPMKGYYYSGTFNNDFGCGFTQYFYSGDPLVGITDITGAALSLEAYPNPAQQELNVDIAGAGQVNGTIRIIDIMGRTVSETKTTTAHQRIDVSALAGGVYTVLFVDHTSGSKLQSRLLIAR